MQHSNSRVFAVVGVVMAATAAACLVMPAARQLGPATGLLMAAAIIGIPVLLVLFGSPALCVLILGLLALRMVPGRSEDVSIHREAQLQ